MEENVVRIFDTTLRDGEQAPGNAMTPEEKLRLARQLDALGVDVIEAGFPAASDGDFPGVRAVAEEVRRPPLAALARCHDRDIALAGERLPPPAPVGYALPFEYGAMFRAVRERVPAARGVALSCHCHDDLGLAVANSLAAVEAGATQVECTVNGIGERAGNASLEEVVMAGRVRPRSVSFRTNVNTREIFRTSQLLSHLTGVFPPPNKAVVGRNAFAHEAGIHQHGMMQNGLTYEIMRPEEVGIPHSTLVLGKHSGRHALERRYRELGYDLDEQALEGLYREFTALADRKHEILDEDLLALLHESFRDVPEAYQLTFLRVSCGMASPTAEVALAGPRHGERSGSGTADSPIAATYHAIGEVVGRSVEVVNLSLRSVTPGKDSVGHVFVQVRVDGKTLTGHGASTDIVEASARALVHALNKADHADKLEATSLNSVYLWGV